MRRVMNGGGVMRVFRRRRRQRTMSRTLIGLLTAASALAVLVFLRELPSLRRYMRIERM